MKTWSIIISPLLLAVVGGCARDDSSATPLAPSLPDPVASPAAASYTLLAGAANVVTAQVLPNALCVLQSDRAGKSLELVSDDEGNVSFKVSPSQPGIVTHPGLSCSDKAGRAATYPLELRSAEGVPALRAPAPRGTVRPPLANPEMERTDDELRAGGYPRRPDPIKAPAEYKQWLDLVSSPGTFVTQALGQAPPTRTHNTTQQTSNWAGYGATNDYPFLEVYGKWTQPQPSFPEGMTNQLFAASIWVGLGDGHSGGTMWQAGTSTSAYTEDSDVGFELVESSSIWMELLGDCGVIDFTYSPPNPNDSMSTWLWFSESSSCEGVGITGNNSTQYLGLQIINHTQNLTYSWCQPVTWFLTTLDCSATAVTGGAAEWILERPWCAPSDLGPENCSGQHFLPSLPNTATSISQAETYTNGGWDWFSSLPNTMFEMDNNTIGGFCDSDTGDKLADATSLTSVVQMNWYNYY
jgi:hypothetical protein